MLLLLASNLEVAWFVGGLQFVIGSMHSTVAMALIRYDMYLVMVCNQAYDPEFAK